jgi:adenosine deaminase
VNEPVGRAGERRLAALPKSHLHIHLEGAMRPTTLAELARERGIEVPPIRGYGSFTAFAGQYVAACDVLTSETQLRRLVDEVVADAAADGAWWIETAWYPLRHLPLAGGDRVALLELMLDANATAAKRHGVGVGLMVTVDRTRSVDEAVELAQLAARFAGEGVVSFGLANDEALFPPEPFAPAFDIARSAGLLSAPHAGELDGPGSVVGALDALGADRIEHGVRAVEDPAVLARLADEGVVCDVCPTSNVLLSVYPSFDEHPLPAMLDAGVRCSINADDPLLFGPGLLDEYALCRERLGLSDGTLAAIARTSFEASGAPPSLGQDALAAIDAWLAT